MRTKLPAVAVLALLILLGGCATSSSTGVASPPPLRSTLTPTSASARATITKQHNSTPGVMTATPAPTQDVQPTTSASPMPTPTAAPDASADFATAMRPTLAGDVIAHADLPRYFLRMWVVPDEGVLTGTERIFFSNRTGAPLSEVALRLYPNFPRDVFGKGGHVQIDVI